ncbi:MAG: alpha-amylase family glycosyl hydrolase [Bacteroidota bacterium]
MKRVLLAALIPALLVLPTPAAAQSGGLPWWNDCVFYEIFVRSFYDANADGTGDFAGLIQKLDYLNDGNPATTTDLGVTGIWLMPVSPSPSYHGYDVTDYRGIEQDYGTMQDFRTFLAAAHARGIRVVVDFVMNHSSSQHPWFVQSAPDPGSPYRSWYRWEAVNPGYTGPWGQQVWHSLYGAWYFGLFWGGMPDLNYATAAAKDTMFAITRYWLEDVGVDGFRLDAIKHLFEDGPVMEHVPATFTFLRQFRQFYKGVDSAAMTVGEVWSPTNQVAWYVDGTGVDYCFEFNLAGSILSAVSSGQPDAVINAMQEVTGAYPALQYAPFLTNHDQTRVFNQLGQDMTKMKQAAALLLTLPGIPYMYYGEEVGMLGSGPDEDKRKPMQWSTAPHAGFTAGTPWRAVNSNYALYNVAVMQADQNSLWHRYRKLIAIRNAQVALRSGDYAPVSNGTSGLYSFTRRSPEQMIVVLHNFQNQTVSSPVLTLAGSPLPGGTYAVEELLGGENAGILTLGASGSFTNWTVPVSIPAKGTAILRIAPTTAQVALAEGWNLISLPVAPEGRRVSGLFPSASGPAFAFDPGTGYAACDTLETGRGYWLKFPWAGTAAVTGLYLAAETLAVSAGWNLVGGLSATAGTGSVATLPPGLISSSFYRYDGGGSYTAVSALSPGQGYWVKTSGDGLMILQGSAPSPAGSRNP